MNRELRQKTIEESASLYVEAKPYVEGEVGDEPPYGDTRVISYCPGNGTRYVLVITDIGRIEKVGLDMLGRSGPRCFQVAWMNAGAGRAMTVGGGDFLHFRYVMEKLHTTEVDAVVLAEVIAHFCKLEAVSCEEYDARDNVG